MKLPKYILDTESFDHLRNSLARPKVKEGTAVHNTSILLPGSISSFIRITVNTLNKSSRIHTMNESFNMDPPAAVTNSINRRKRDSTDNDSQLSDESSAIDSSRAVAPKPRRKRQRTFLNAFSSITLQKQDGDFTSEDEYADADSSKAVADEAYDCACSVSSSLEDELSQEDRFLSDKEEAERKVMLELVFGPEQGTDVVDAKLADLVRKSITQATKMGSTDDMELDASYQRSIERSASPGSSLTGSLKRSSSLPSIFDDSMDTDL